MTINKNFKAKGTLQGFLRFAEIIHVDYFKRSCDIRYMDGDNFESDVSFLSPVHGLNSFMGGMPDVGSVAIVSQYRLGVGRGRAIILGFLPRFLFFAYTFEPIKVREKTKTEFDRILARERLKYWKLYPGEFLISSKQGSDLRVDKGIFLQNSAMNEFKLDPFSQVASILAFNQTFTSKAGRMNFGFIHRNDLLDSKEFEDRFIPASQFLSDGRKFFRVTTSPKEVEQEYGTKSLDDPGMLGYTEFRLDIPELADDVLDATDESIGLNGSPITKSGGGDNDAFVKKPLVSFSLGTLVGNDSVSKDGRNQYGKILMPVTFSSSDSNKVIGNFAVVENTNKVNGEQTQAAAVHVAVPNTRTSWNITKKGVLEATYDSSDSTHPLGAGRSANIGMLGSLKAVLGKQASDGVSLLLDLAGGAKININGAELNNNRSLDVLLAQGVNFEILGSDRNRNSIRGRVNGNIDIVVEGNHTEEVKGDLITLVHGKHETQCLGKKVDNFVSDKANNYGGGLKENVVGSFQNNIGSGRKCTIGAPDILNGETVADSQTILLGDKELKMLLGNLKRSLLAGTIEDNIGLGTKTTNIGIGSYEVSVGLGNIDISTAIGNASFGTTLGSTTITGVAGVELKALSIKFNAPLVTIGSLVQQGVVTGGPLGHLDYITGLPLRGSISVTCNAL